MRKVLLLSFMLVVAWLGFNGVYAEELVETVEPSTFDNWMATLGDWASIKNFLVTGMSFGGVITLFKIRSAYKFFKTPKGIATIENIFVNVLGKVTEKPELVMKLGAILVEMPIIKNILNVFQKKANIYALELEGKILDIEAKLSAQVYEGDKLQEATAYLTKLRTEYETTKLN